MNLLRYLFRESGRLFAFATFAAVLSGVCGASLAKVIGDGVQNINAYASYAIPFFALCAGYLTAKSCSEIALIHLVQNAILRLRVDLSRQILATPLKQLQRLGKSELMAILTNDVTAFVQAFQTLPLVFGNSVIITVCCGYMAWLSWQLFALFTVTLLLCLGGYHFAERRPLALMVTLREKLDDLYAHFRNLTEGTKELQLNADRGRSFVYDVIAPDARDFKRLFVHALSAYAWVSNIGLVLFYVIIGMLLFVIPAWLPQPANVLTTYALMLLFLVRPISDMMICLPILRQAAISLNKIQQLEDVLAGFTATSVEPDPFHGHGALKLELRDVCHHYPGLAEDHQFMLGPMNLSIRQGEILYVVGANGSGKTTLALLLLGFYAPESGEVRLNGVPVTAANLASYRQRFSAVFADFHLFEQLLTANKPEIAERAQHYINKLEMSHKVKVENGRFSTIDLSTGQRKRLALVSSYLEDREIYLFDEWAADQDPAFKRVFYTELLPELKARGKTVIIITHDDAYFQYADRIIKLKEGRLEQAIEDNPMPALAVAEPA